MNNEEKKKELTLLLLYLNSWDEEGYERDEKSWKGFDFDTLNVLEKENYLSGSYKSKSVFLTKNGEKKALELYRKYLG